VHLEKETYHSCISYDQLCIWPDHHASGSRSNRKLGEPATHNLNNPTRRRFEFWSNALHSLRPFFSANSSFKFKSWPEQNAAKFQMFSSLRSDIFHCPWRLLLHSWVPTGRTGCVPWDTLKTGCTDYVTLSHVVSLYRTHGARTTRWNWDQCSNARSSFIANHPSYGNLMAS